MRDDDLEILDGYFQFIFFKIKVTMIASDETMILDIKSHCHCNQV